MMVSADFAQSGREAAAFRDGHKAAGMKRTTLGRIQGTGYLPLQDDAFAAFVDEGIGDRNGGKQGFGVGVERIFIERPRVGHFHDSSQIHDGYPVAHMPHYGKIVGNEEVA